MAGESAGRERWILALLAAMGAAGVALVLAATGRYGAGLSQDSVEYVVAARNLMSGNGYLTSWGRPFVLWGPLLPTLLASAGWLGVNLWQAGRWLNALAFGLTVFGSGLLFRRILRSRALAVVGTLSTFGYPLIFVSTYIWSEGLFALLVLWFLLRLIVVIERPTRANWAWLVVPAALACIQRYIGAVTVATGCLVLALSRSGPRAELFGVNVLLKRMAGTALFGAVALTPVAAWMVRNHQVTGRWTGGRGPLDTVAMGVHLQRVYRTMAGWFPSAVAPVVVAAVFVVMGAAVAWMVFGPMRGLYDMVRGQVRGAPTPAAEAGLEKREPELWAIAAPVALVWVYLVALLYSALQLGISPIDDRFLAPIYVPVIGVVLFPVDWLVQHVSGGPERGAGLRRGAIIVLTAVALIVPLGRTCSYVQAARETGVRGFSDRSWAKSPITKWLRHNPLEGELYTNDISPLAIVAGRSIRWVPQEARDVKSFLDKLGKQTGPKYVIWYNAASAWRWPREVLDALLASGRLQLVKKSSDGAVYRVGP